MRTFRGEHLRLRPDGFQCHHLIPVAVIGNPVFSRFFEELRGEGFDPHDFRSNGIFLPCTEKCAVEMGLPLHRGPHPLYNKLVAERVFQISIERCGDPGKRSSAMKRLQLSLLDELKARPARFVLNRRSLMNAKIEFGSLDASVDRIWRGTEDAVPVS